MDGTQSAQERDERVAAGASREFSGNPARYMRLSILISTVIHVYLILGMIVFEFVIHEQTWIFGWKPIVFTLVFYVLFTRMIYRWMMRLDAQYGSGRGWTLKRRTVSLPDTTKPH